MKKADCIVTGIFIILALICLIAGKCMKEYYMAAVAGVVLVVAVATMFYQYHKIKKAEKRKEDLSNEE